MNRGEGEGEALKRVLSALDAGNWEYRTNGEGRWRAQCPAHAGKDRNLAIALGDQSVLLRCHSRGCTAEKVSEALGLKLSDLFDRDGKAVYDYGPCKVTRTRTTGDGKSIRVHPPRAMPATRPPWLAPGSAPLQESETVYWAEGEKSAEALHRLGAACAFTYPGGTGGISKADLTPLAGKHVVIVPDNDKPGQKAALKLAQLITPHAAHVSIQRVPESWEDSQPLNDPADLWLAGGKLADLGHPIRPPSLEASSEENGSHIVGRKASEVTTKRLLWLWADRIPLGTLAVFAGRGGEGKSTFALYLAARLTRGSLPGEREGQPVNVGIASLEDDDATVTVPRLIAAGADLERVHLFTTDSEGLLLSLPHSAEALAAFIKEHELAVVILDPSTSMLDGNHNNRHEVRRALDPLLVVAQETGCTFIMVQHLNKGAGHMSDKIAGSAAFRDTARCVLLFAADTNSGERVATFNKGNYAAELAPSISFTIDSCDVKLSDGHTTNVGAVANIADTERDAETILNDRYQVKPSDQVEARGRAQSFIIKHLEDKGGSAPAREVLDAAVAAGLTEDQVKSARRRCKNPRVLTDRDGFAGGVTWLLDPNHPKPIDGVDIDVGVIGGAQMNTPPMTPMDAPATPMEQPEAAESSAVNHSTALEAT